MSSTTRGNNVENDDFFETPSWVVKAILPYLPATGAVLDPCCGEGAILDIVPYGRPTFGIELNANRAAMARVTGINVVATGDALAMPWPDAPVVIQNPPFSLAHDFVEKSIDHVMLPYAQDSAAAVLLRLAFLESEERLELHTKHPCDVYPLAYRPSFAAVVSCVKGKKGGCAWRVTLPLKAQRPTSCPVCNDRVKVNTTDSCAYAWFVWGPGRGGRIKVLDDAPPNARKARRRDAPIIEPSHVEAIAQMVCP